jgi:acetate kinase
MAVTFIVNPGSSSKKYALYAGTKLLLAAHVERAEKGTILCTMADGSQDRCQMIGDNTYETSLLDFLERALNEKVITSTTDIMVVGVRVVAPGTAFTTHRIIDDTFMRDLAMAANRAPLHVPHTEHELKVLRQALPHATFVAASDSAFHAAMPAWAKSYSLPASDAALHDIYRFGYHGLSVAGALRKLAKLPDVSANRVIVCHLGSGVSVTAVRDGQSIDTTMGYAPGSGLIMGSRAGDIDAGALLALMEERRFKVADAQTYLQTKGGLNGIAGESDLRFLLEARAKGEKKATLAIDSFIYAIQKAIGAYVAVLGGLDTLVFTATAGERSPVLRALITAPLLGLGISLDEDKNNALISRDGVISVDNGVVSVVVLKSEEATEILAVATKLTA